MKFLYVAYLRPALEEKGLPTRPEKITNEHRLAYVTGTPEALLLNLLERVFFLKDNLPDSASAALDLYCIGYDMAASGIGRVGADTISTGTRSGFKSGAKRRENREKARCYSIAFIEKFKANPEPFMGGLKRTTRAAIRALLKADWDAVTLGKKPTEHTLQKWYTDYRAELKREKPSAEDDEQIAARLEQESRTAAGWYKRQ
ncbi:MAG: hypothetical protein O2968_20350 [Acidobacteria bacterium]|nr:hypothetical protein [Acidobacteriota bacterium]